MPGYLLLVIGFSRMFHIDQDGSKINYLFAGKSNFLVDFQSLFLQKPRHYFRQAWVDSELYTLYLNNTNSRPINFCSGCFLTVTISIKDQYSAKHYNSSRKKRFVDKGNNNISHSGNTL